MIVRLFSRRKQLANRETKLRRAVRLAATPTFSRPTFDGALRESRRGIRIFQRERNANAKQINFTPK
jgi:hypothetical protein